MHPYVTDLAGVARFLGVHPRTAAAYAKTGQIPGLRIGHWRFWMPAILALVSPHREDAVSDDTPEVVSPDQLAALLGMTPATVYNHIKSGAVPATRIGRRYLIHWPTIRAAIAAGRSPNGGAAGKG